MFSRKAGEGVATLAAFNFLIVLVAVPLTEFAVADSIRRLGAVVERAMLGRRTKRRRGLLAKTTGCRDFGSGFEPAICS